MLYLTSSVASVAGHMYQNYLVDKGYKTILFIDTAAEPEIGKEKGDDDWLQDDLHSLRDQGYQVDRYTVTNKSHDEIEQAIDEYDVIYMCGGNTAYLLDKLRKSGSFELIKEKVNDGKTYIGTSAGSIIAGPRLPDYFGDEQPELEDRTCFNFVNFTLVPHWGSIHFRDVYLSDRLKQVYKDTQDPLLLTTDTQYVVVNDRGEINIVIANN